MNTTMQRKPKFWSSLIIGELLSAVGATRLAAKVLERALKAALDSGGSGRIAAVYSAQASLEERNGNLNKAITLQTKALEIAPVDEVGMTHCELALLYKAKGNYQEAVFHFAYALELLGPDYHEYRESIEAELEDCRRKVSEFHC